MSARLTVVLDDESLYREAKIRAAEDGVPLKDIITRALSEYLSKRGRPPKEKRLTLEALDRWWAESERMDAELGVEYPTDLSDIKHHLYGWPKQRERHPNPDPGDWESYVAEERAGYDA